MRGPPVGTKEHLLARRKIENDCWIWTGGTNGKYGVTGTNRGGSFYIHRRAYELWHGPIPPKMYICHKCDTPLCFNPEHLFCAHPSENTRDMILKRRHAHGEKQPTSKLKESEVVHILTSDERSRVLAKRYNVSEAAISLIRSRKNWAHIDLDSSA